VDVRELSRLRAGLVEPEEIANACRRRDQENKPRRIRHGAIVQHRLIASGHVRHFPRDSIKRAEVRLAFFDVKHVDTASICGPDWWITTTGAWRHVVTTHAAADIKIKIGGEVARLGARN